MRIKRLVDQKKSLLSLRALAQVLWLQYNDAYPGSVGCSSWAFKQSNACLTYCTCDLPMLWIPFLDLKVQCVKFVFIGFPTLWWFFFMFISCHVCFLAVDTMSQCELYVHCCSICTARKRPMQRSHALLQQSHWQGPGEIMEHLPEVVYWARMLRQGHMVVLHHDIWDDWSLSWGLCVGRWKQDAPL